MGRYSVGLLVTIILGVFLVSSVTEAGIFGRRRGRYRNYNRQNQNFNHGNGNRQRQPSREPSEDDAGEVEEPEVESRRPIAPPTPGSAAKKGKFTPISLSEMTPANRALVKAIRRHPAQSTNGTANPLLCDMAHDHNVWMSQGGGLRRIGHSGAKERAQTISRNRGQGFAEIVAGHGPSRGSDEEDARQCANQWRNSGGHWASMRRYWTHYCYTMLKVRGYVYCTGLFSNHLPTTTPEPTPSIAQDGETFPAPGLDRADAEVAKVPEDPNAKFASTLPKVPAGSFALPFIRR